MDEAPIAYYITTTFKGIESVVADGNTFFFYGSDHKMPFTTLVTKDDYDSVSNLNRPSIFRLNIVIAKPTYLSLFGPPPTGPIGAPSANSPHDFTALDTLMPHPIYAQMFWVCILNPTDATFQTVKPLLAEAYALAVGVHTKRASHE